MDAQLKRRLAIGAAALAAAGGAGGAYAAGHSSGGSPRQAYVADVAARLHVTPQQLRSAMKAAFKDRLQAAVKAGRLTQAQADAIEQRMQRRGGAHPFMGPRMHRFGMPRLRAGGPFATIFAATAKYVGMTPAQLRDQLVAGKSLAQVATAQGKTVDGLKQAIKAAVDSALDARLDAIVNRTGFGPPRGMAPPPGAPVPPGT